MEMEEFSKINMNYVEFFQVKAFSEKIPQSLFSVPKQS